CWIKDLKAEADAIKAEKNALAKRQTVCENKVEQLKDYLTRALNGIKFKDARCSISYRKSESVEVEDSVIDKLPEEYIKVEKTVRKTELKDAMKLGFEFEGCRLIEKNNIQIR
ncbi:MAG: siphovirus Gp157 family protein, partial [Methanobrevibacter sp.]|nr:siphovirus Gp157 family protein [Methanobrevibacter sp.]